MEATNQTNTQEKKVDRIRDLPTGNILMDGATGTELDRRGVDCSLPLWSARAMIDAPGILQEIHETYLNVGAHGIVTNTFRTHQRSLEKAEIGDQAEALTKQATEIAKAARDKINPDALVFGSVTSLEDCYSPELTPDYETCLKEHRQIVRHLVEAGVDLILIETVPTALEALAAAQAAEELAPGRWGVSFCMKKSDEPGIIMSGDQISEVIPKLSKARFVGVNCITATQIESEVKHLRSLLPESTRIIAYGNVGYPDDVKGWINTDAVDPLIHASYVKKWIEAGASIVGSCCGTGPDTTAALKKVCFDDAQATTSK